MRHFDHQSSGRPNPPRLLVTTMRSLPESGNCKVSGFTLVEVLVVVAVLVILATVGIPNFGPTVANSRATSAANDLLGSLQLARSEAARLNEPVLIVPTGGTWTDGWRIERDGEPIRERHALPRVTITGPDRMEFGSAGNATPEPADRFDFQITADGGGNPRRCLSVTASGSAAVNHGDC